MTVLFNGTPVGENTFTVATDGTFVSQVALKLGATEIAGRVQGHLREGRLVDYTMEQTQAKRSVKLTLNTGKLTATLPDGKSVDLPYDASVKTYFGNLHPGFTTSLLKAADWNKKQSQKIAS